MVRLASLTLFALSLSTGAFAFPSHTRRAMKVHGQRTRVPAGFATAKSRPSDSETMSFRIGLRPADIAGLEEKLYSVSTPGSATYGQYLSKDEVSDDGLTSSNLCLIASMCRSKHTPHLPPNPSLP